MKKPTSRSAPPRIVADMGRILAVSMEPGLLGRLIPVAPDPADLRRLLHAADTLQRSEELARVPVLGRPAPAPPRR